MIPNPHDRLIHGMLEDLTIARAALETLLPQDILAVLDLSSLRRLPADFVGELLEEMRGDLLFEVQRLDGARTLIYVLLEHQSSPDHHMARRLLRYMSEIWQVCSLQRPQERLLPPILPVVFYHGPVPWHPSTRLQDQVRVEGLPAEVLKLIPDFSYLLHDVSKIPDDDLRGNACWHLTRLLFKYVYREELWERLPRWREVFTEVYRSPSGLRAVSLVLRYVVETTLTAPPPQVEQFLIENLGESAMQELGGWARQLREEGRREGREEGRKEGREEGREKGRESALRHAFFRLAGQRFGVIPEEVAARVARARPDEIEGWLLNLLTAQTLAEALDGA